MASEEQVLPFSLLSLNREAFENLSTRQKMSAVVAVAVSVTVLVGAWMWSRTVDYSVLFSNFSEQDGGQIIASLQQMNVPYKISDSGTAILVSASQVHDIRLKLAVQGLPKGGLVGFEVMETQKLGASQFLEQINYQRALEGELARSIQGLQAVKGARVHLAIPKQSAFLRDEQKPTASVLINLHPGRTLEPRQVAGIVHLVSSSVPQLNPANVSVIDQNGNLITQLDDPLRNMGLDPTQFKFLRELEGRYIKRIEDILAPVAGAGNIRAQVTADVDFSQIDQMAETYKPNPSPETAIRSQQTAEAATNSPNAMGVPGALTNQPPVPATAPITTPAVQGQAGLTSNAQAPLNYNKNATLNYELDKTVKHTKGQPGSVKRLSVAVVVNYKSGPPDKNGKSKPIPLPDNEMKQINDLVREAMGYNKERGDTLNVANVPFSPDIKELAPETPLWKDPEIVTLAREGLKYLVLAAIAFLLWSKLMKPMINTIMEAEAKKKERERLALEAERRAQGLADEDAASEPLRQYETKLETARELAKNDPKLVANVIRDWVAGNEG